MVDFCELSRTSSLFSTCPYPVLGVVPCGAVWYGLVRFGAVRSPGSDNIAVRRGAIFSKEKSCGAMRISSFGNTTVRCGLVQFDKAAMNRTASSETRQTMKRPGKIHFVSAQVCGGQYNENSGVATIASVSAQ